ncbi:unnamed protein product [Mytilus coruscus]|uniref:Caspase family p20 domain-containing protein n=1 Tax=Mytilus coruscus TaxID=42192 RepID=A0A6J8A0M1_MYTCO|nr:unnamed protein product [Mytilus coruscus]
MESECCFKSTHEVNSDNFTALMTDSNIIIHCHFEHFAKNRQGNNIQADEIEYRSVSNETRCCDDVNKSLQRRISHTFSLTTWSSDYSRENPESSDYGTLEKNLEENDAHTFSCPLKGDLISKDSLPVACCGIQESNGRPLESVVRNDIVPSNRNPSWNSMPYINNEANIPYRMDNLRRGTCIIFNVAVVEGRFRVGSHIDVRKLKQTFVFLGFVVYEINNPSKSEINGTLNNYTAADHSHDDCFAWVTLSHGGNDGNNKKFRVWLENQSFSLFRHVEEQIRNITV